MVPFLKASAEINAQKAKAFAEDMKKMTLLAASNDDKLYSASETEARAANE